MTRSQSGRRFNAPLGRLDALGPFHFAVATTVAFALILALYLATGFILAPVLAAAAVGVGVDRVVRMHPQWRYHGPWATAPFLFLPCLLAFCSVLALGESDSRGVEAGIGLLVVLLVAATVMGEYLTVDPAAETYEVARFVLLFSIYVTALFAFVVTFIFDLPLPLHVAIVFAVTLLLTADMLRELERVSTALWIQSGAVALVMAECRWVVYYLSLSDVFAAAFMLFVYYPMTGLVQDHVAERADRRTWTQWATVFVVTSLLLLFVRLAFL